MKKTVLALSLSLVLLAALLAGCAAPAVPEALTALWLVYSRFRRRFKK